MCDGTAIETENNAQVRAAKIIPFRQKELLLINNAGEPFVPMKPVVEGMGLDWKTQYRKLQGGRFNTCMVMMTIQLPGHAQRREVSCLPLRKLAGWLTSIHASKVRPELREGVIAYQNECDDALWAYWNEGGAIRHDDRTVASVLSATIGTNGFNCLAAVLDGKLRNLKGGTKRAAKNHIWQQVHRAFSVVSAEDIPASQLDAARNFIAAYALEGEWIERERPAKGGLEIHYPVARWLEENPELAKAQQPGSLLLAAQMLYGPDYRSPILKLLAELAAAGYNVEACKIEAQAMRHHVESMDIRLGEIFRQTMIGRQRGIRIPVDGMSAVVKTLSRSGQAA